jgi:hypothetical protein
MSELDLLCRKVLCICAVEKCPKATSYCDQRVLIARDTCRTLVQHFPSLI